MGKDKAFLDFNGKSFIKVIAEKLSKKCNQLIISANKEEKIYRQELTGIDFEFVKDNNPYEGPLNAISSSVDLIKHNLVFIATCDTPFLNENLTEMFIDEIESYEAVIPIINNKPQPLNTLYTKQAVIKAKHLFGTTKSLIGWIQNLNYKVLDQKKIESIDPKTLSYLSINTPQDYERYVKKI